MGVRIPSGVLTKTIVMKTRILKKINQRVRIIEKNGRFVVENKEYGSNEWKLMNELSTYRRAMDIKHSYIVMILMRDMGYRNEFIKRRTKRKK
jgi:hypothetical protein